jgi:hypothetical protein
VTTKQRMALVREALSDVGNPHCTVQMQRALAALDGLDLAGDEGLVKDVQLAINRAPTGGGARPVLAVVTEHLKGGGP